MSSVVFGGSTHAFVFAVAYAHAGPLDRPSNRLRYEPSKRSRASRVDIQNVACATSCSSSRLAKRARSCGAVATRDGMAVVRAWAGRYLTDAKIRRNVSRPDHPCGDLYVLGLRFCRCVEGRLSFGSTSGRYLDECGLALLWLCLALVAANWRKIAHFTNYAHG